MHACEVLLIGHASVWAAHRPSLLYLVWPSASSLLFSFYSVSSASHFAPSDMNAMPAADAISSYPSEPLGENSVRFLRLQPAKNKTCPLVATLEVSCFPPRDTYEALSYVWGTSTRDYCVHLSGSRFEIRENLYSALIQLRKTDQERILWIDALCINQANDVEKARQVAMMGE